MTLQLTNMKHETDIRDVDFSVRTQLALRNAQLNSIQDIKELGRLKFLKSKHSYSVRLEVLNYFHKNNISFKGDKNFENVIITNDLRIELLKILEYFKSGLADIKESSEEDQPMLDELKVVIEKLKETD